jgi:hypothetical protein
MDLEISNKELSEELAELRSAYQQIRLAHMKLTRETQVLQQKFGFEARALTEPGIYLIYLLEIYYLLPSACPPLPPRPPPSTLCLPSSLSLHPRSFCWIFFLENSFLIFLSKILQIFTGKPNNLELRGITDEMERLIRKILDPELHVHRKYMEGYVDLHFKNQNVIRRNFVAILRKALYWVRRGCGSREGGGDRRRAR